MYEINLIFMVHQPLNSIFVFSQWYTFYLSPKKKPFDTIQKSRQFPEIKTYPMTYNSEEWVKVAPGNQHLNTVHRKPVKKYLADIYVILTCTTHG